MPDEDLPARVRRLAAEREALRLARTEVTEQLRAATLALIEAGMPESEAARLAGVNRNTVRTWQSKQGWL
jgi:DNA-directed RNA polymerase specialized sigma24 family protein